MSACPRGCGCARPPAPSCAAYPWPRCSPRPRLSSNERSCPPYARDLCSLPLSAIDALSAAGRCAPPRTWRKRPC
eukprot:355109-Alexandrium_andersonii.AAC.1